MANNKDKKEQMPVEPTEGQGLYSEMKEQDSFDEAFDEAEANDVKHEEAQATPATESSASEDRKLIEQLHRSRHFKIVINSGRGAQDRGPVFLAVNGREYLIKRDTEVVVPEAVVNVLKLAEVTRAVTTMVDGQAQTRFEKTRRFSFSVNGEAPAPVRTR